MNESDLDRSYSALCKALGDVGAQRSELLLGMLVLALIARAEDADDVLALIARSRDRCLEG
jgi:hypothetical protein